MHLDLRADDLDREVARLTALGATVMSDQPLADLVVMRDPEGNEFCLLLGLGKPDGCRDVATVMDLGDALSFAAARHHGVLVTQKANGRPQLSNIAYAVSDGAARISITADRAKYRNLQRVPYASLHVTQEDFWAYVVIEADVELSPIAADPHDATVGELIDVYRAMAGEHPDWDDYRRAMVADQRVVVRLRPTHAYGMIT